MILHEWKFYSLKVGWSMRVTYGKRTVFWLSPRACCFEVLLILGAKAMAAARQGRMPQRAVKALGEARKYPERTGLRL